MWTLEQVWLRTVALAELLSTSPSFLYTFLSQTAFSRELVLIHGAWVCAQLCLTLRLRGL